MRLDDLDGFSYAYFMRAAMAEIPDTMDKREGGLIFDALAPACRRLAEFCITLKEFALSWRAESADGEWLDAKAAEQGLKMLLGVE